jgi:transposase InsO family protein
VRYGYFRIYILLRLHPAPARRLEDQSRARVPAVSSGGAQHAAQTAAAPRDGGAPRAPACGRINQSWSMDFVSDALFDGRRIRALTVVDDCSRESLAIEVGPSITGEQVVTGHESAQRKCVERRSAFASKTGPSLYQGHLISGRISIGYARLQPARKTDRQRVGLNLSTNGCGTNV